MALSQISDAIPASVVNLLNTGNAAPVAGAYPTAPTPDRYDRFTLGSGRVTFKTQVMVSNAAFANSVAATPAIIVPAVPGKIINMLMTRVYVGGQMVTPAFAAAGFALNQPQINSVPYVALTSPGGTSLTIALGAAGATAVSATTALTTPNMAAPFMLQFPAIATIATLANLINQPLVLLQAVALTAGNASNRIVVEVEYEVIDSTNI